MANAEKIVTRELVFEVADRIRAEGIEPSNRKVLQEIGGGSMTTIAGHLREWKAHQSIAVPTPADVVQVPPLVVEAGNQAVAVIWQACSAEARREVEAVTEQANQRVKVAEEERDRVLTELAEAEEELSVEHHRVDALKNELLSEGQQLQVLRDSSQHFQAESEKAKAVADEVERRAAGLADALSHERERADRLQSDIEQVASACSQAKQEAAVLAERLAVADAKATSAEGATRAIEAKLEEANAARTRAEKEAAVLAERLAVADAKATSAEGATHAIEAKLEEANAARTRAEKEAAVLAERLETFKVGKTKSPKADS
jgi:chromosome segregation ATPase